MRILGIDPGFAITGYSIIDYIGNKFDLIASGAVTTKAGESFPLRLLKLNNDLENIIDEYKPDAISVEELFFNNNAKFVKNVIFVYNFYAYYTRIFTENYKIVFGKPFSS